ncbi:MAG: class II fructose-bisphosphatase [Candidatus Midichloria mitochondrii]|uniref:Fructose-1,6-bisphosphatase n=2 Tax=Candidatus Midichloria mitochondrii TaxID=234827 RepID=F7XVD0_MIDMI|nr:fructose-1,6-bisphosphatase [Candidatus Midichloria mitochondrii IricVA]
MNKNMNKLNKLLYNITEITSKSAIACHSCIGLGDERGADQAAVESMRASLNNLEISGRVVIGEGERDDAPMLYIGELLGKSGVDIDIAVDPLEGTTICAHNKPDSISVLAISEASNMLNAPDVYMEKIAIGKNLPQDLVDLDEPIEKNLKSLATAKKCLVQDLNVCLLNRPRHVELIKVLRAQGVRIKLIDDGDVLACLKTCLEGGDIDMYLGIGGAPEGVLAAAGLKCLGGQMQGRLIFNTQEEIARANSIGIIDLSKKYNIHEMVKGEAMLSATWVTDGFFKGVKKMENNCYTTETLLLAPNIIRIIKTAYI